MAEIDLDALLSVAADAAREAGEALRAHRLQWSGIESVVGREVKVGADRKAEAIVLDALKAAPEIAGRPIPILSEEAGWVGEREGDLAWAVDPLDGSVNYIKGYPHCAVSIALMRGREPLLGVIDCFLLNETFTGIVGRGAKLNGGAIKVSSAADRGAGILATGIPARAQIDGPVFEAFMTDMLQWRKVRMIGSAAAALAYVACGRADFYRESGAMLWDVAGGCALVLAAGGRVRMDGPALDQPLTVAASNAGLVSYLHG
ncbi:MAG TPA: inositol monophosphatase [Caulobacterales bacterium]|nr:inositol monophosphatase [Caulobacterales bacterium]